MQLISQQWEQGYLTLEALTQGAALFTWSEPEPAMSWQPMGLKRAILFTLLPLQTIPPAAIPLTFICTNWWRPYLSLGRCEWPCRHRYRPPRASLLCLCTSRQAFAPPFPDGTKAWGRLQEELQSWCYVGCYPFCIRSQSNLFHALANSYVHFLWERQAAKCTSHLHSADVISLIQRGRDKSPAQPFQSGIVPN